MALRATSSSAIRAAKAEGAPRATATRTLVLDLSSVLAPYKKKHIALRIERVPQRARFSAGRKNGDNSWSLTREDTNDLEYLLPEEVATEHTLAIRIMDLDAAGGSTLALVEYRVSMDEAPPPPAGEDDASDKPAIDAEMRRLREELAKLKTTLAAAQETPRAHGTDAKLTAAEVEINHLRKELEAAKTQQEHEIATHLAEARAEFAAELEHRMSAATGTTAAEIQRHRAAWQAEFVTAQDQWRKDASAALAAAEQTWKQQAQESLAKAEQAWQQQSAASLAKAEQTWKAEEAKRLAAREAEWREQSAKALADARRATDGAREETHGKELAELRAKVATLEASLADRDVVLAESQKAADAAAAESARALQDALAKAEQDWKAAEAKRFADAETAWQAKLDAAAEAARTAAPPPPPTDDEELKQLRAQAAEFKTTLADYDAAMSAAQKAAVEAQANTDNKIAEALAKAEQAWKAAEAARLAAKDAEWQAKLTKAVAETRAEVPPPVVATAAPDDSAEFDKLRAEIEELQTALIDRDATIERLEKDAAAPPSPAQLNLNDELVKAERLWRAGEAERIAAAQSQARFDQQRALNDAVARYEQAEAALAHMRIRAADDNRAHNEVTTLRATLGIRESEIADLKKQLDAARGYVAPEDANDAAPVVAETAKPEPEGAKIPKYARDAGIAAAAGILLVVGYSAFGDLLTPPAPASKPTTAKTAAAVAPAPVVEAPKSLIVKSAKLRAAAEANAAIIARLPVGSEVTELERKGPWARVRHRADEKSDAREGWVYVSVLQEKPAAPQPEAAKKK